MKRLIFLIALLTLGVFPALAQKAVPAKPAAANKPFVSAEGRFSILFPGDPEISVEPMTTDSSEWEMHDFSLKMETQGILYQVTYFDLVKLALVPPAGFFDSLTNGFLEGASDTHIIDQKDTQVAGNSARVVRIAGGDGAFFKTKWVVAGTRAYQLTTAFRSTGTIDQTIRWAEPLADKFLDSFQISAK